MIRAQTCFGRLRDERPLNQAELSRNYSLFPIVGCIGLQDNREATHCENTEADLQGPFSQLKS